MSDLSNNPRVWAANSTLSFPANSGPNSPISEDSQKA